MAIGADKADAGKRFAGDLVVELGPGVAIGKGVARLVVFDDVTTKCGEERALDEDPFAFDGEIAVAVTGQDMARVNHGGIISGGL